MIVLDASTLILLTKCELLRLLAERTKIMIPPEVKREATARPELWDARMVQAMLQAGEIQISKTPRSKLRRRIERDFGLEAGEAAALVLASETGSPLGTDDGPAIKAAKILGIPFFTAIHVLLALHEKGQIGETVALAKLDTLQRFGRYGVSILEDARRRITK